MPHRQILLPSRLPALRSWSRCCTSPRLLTGEAGEIGGPAFLDNQLVGHATLLLRVHCYLLRHTNAVGFSPSFLSANIRSADYVKTKTFRASLYTDRESIFMPSAPTSYPGPGRRIPLVVGLVFMSTFFVILKIYARFKTKVAFGADDYLVYVCVLLNIPYMVLSIWSRLRLYIHETKRSWS